MIGSTTVIMDNPEETEKPKHDEQKKNEFIISMTEKQGNIIPLLLLCLY